MSVSYQIPPQSRFIPTANVFQATFNVPTPGVYDFTNNVLNQNVTIMKLKPNTVYIIDRISAGGNITEGQFLESISDFPLLYIKKKIGKENVYTKPIPITNFFDGSEASAWFHSDKLGNELQATFTGVLNQLPSMVGLATAKIQISLNVFAVDSNYWNISYRQQLSKTIGQRNRRY